VNGSALTVVATITRRIHELPIRVLKARFGFFHDSLFHVKGSQNVAT
jgi:hypothetical protein